MSLVTPQTLRIGGPGLLALSEAAVQGEGADQAAERHRARFRISWEYKFEVG